MNNVQTSAGTLSYILQKVAPFCSQGEVVAVALQRAIEQCSSEQELLDLYFTTDYPVTSQAVRLFELRLHEVNRPC